MTPIEILALSRLVQIAEEKLARKQIAPGTYNVDLNIHASGSLVVEPDYEKRATVTVPWTEAYALFREVVVQGVDSLMSRVEQGETITKADLECIKTAGFLSEDIMVETMQEAIRIKKAHAEGSIMERVPEVEAAAERVKELIAGRLPPSHSSGRVLTDLKVEQVQAQTPQGAPAHQIAPAVPPAGLTAPVTP